VTGENHRDGAGTDATGWWTQLSRGFPSTLLKDVRRDSLGGQIVAMMQSAESRHGNDLAICIVMDLGFTTSRCFLLQPKMRSVVVIITNVCKRMVWAVLVGVCVSMNGVGI